MSPTREREAAEQLRAEASRPVRRTSRLAANVTPPAPRPVNLRPNVFDIVQAARTDAELIVDKLNGYEWNAARHMVATEALAATRRLAANLSILIDYEEVG